MSITPVEYLPTRESLLKRLRDLEDQTAWKRFFDSYWKLIYEVARKAGLTDAEAQDVVQETIISIARKMPEFRYDAAIGSFKSWLLQMTRWRIIDQMRKKRFQCHGRSLTRERRLDTQMLESKADPSAFNLDSLWEEEWRKHLLDAAMEKVRRQVSPRHYQMFHLHVIKNMPVKTVAERLGVRSAEVYFAKYKVSAQIKREIKALETKAL